MSARVYRRRKKISKNRENNFLRKSDFFFGPRRPLGISCTPPNGCGETAARLSRTRGRNLAPLGLAGPPCPDWNTRIRGMSVPPRTTFSLKAGRPSPGQQKVDRRLAEMARDREHKPWGKTGDEFLGLATPNDDGTYAMHDSIRSIVVSAAEGEGLDMRLVNPVALPSA